MKRVLNYTMIAGLFLTIILSGCNKKENPDPTPTETNTNYASFSFSDSYGVLVAIKSTTYQSVAGLVIPVEVNTATAAFVSTVGSSTYVNAGNVAVNSKNLAIQSNNAYVYNDLLNPLSFSNVAWAVAGSTEVPAFNYTDDDTWPSFNGYSMLPATVMKSAGLTVALNSAVSNADSVYLIIASNDGKYVISRVGGNAAEVTLTAEQMNTVSAGGGMLQVVPWRYKKEDINSKSFYFVLEAVYSKMNITIQ